jgi:2-polyprenyl-6-methoxyphenol hydroxylase-like FAD-dependent oxidoreductase
MKHTKVIINGAGPTGLALACQLQRYGIDFVILDGNEKTTHLSKAMVVHARTLEIFNEIGLAQKAVAQGQRAERFNIVSRGKVRGQLQLRAFGEGLSQFPFALILEQSKTEKLLADYLSGKEIPIQWRSEMTHFAEESDGVIVYYKDKDGEQQIKGNYLVGADGAASQTRHQLGLGFAGETQERIFYVADVKMQSELNGNNDAWFVMINNGFALFFPMEGEQHYRIIGTVPEHVKDKEQLQFSDIKQLIKDQVQVPVDFLEEYWFSTYKVHSRMVETFSKGRCFVAGDAAHIHTPAGGQGMNTGIQDAYNLGWKLAFVINGKASGKLLDTYNEERRANAKRLLKTTDAMFDVLAGTGTISNFLRLYFFPSVLKWVTKLTFFSKRFFPLLSMIGIKYPESSLTVAGHIGKITSGDRMPYFEIDGQSIYESLKDPAYKLLYFGEAAMDFETAHSNIDLVKLNFKNIPPIFKREKGFYILLRPDNYIAYVGNDSARVNLALSLFAIR